MKEYVKTYANNPELLARAGKQLCVENGEKNIENSQNGAENDGELSPTSLESENQDEKNEGMSE